MTLQSLMASTYQDFDVVIVDQSRSDDTADAVKAGIGADQRFVYLRSQSTGLSAARNIAVDHARGPLVAFTDDDCTVAPDWLERIVAHFDAHKAVGMIFGEVLPAPFDPAAGFIPINHIERSRVIPAAWLKWRTHGIGANMSFRLTALQRAGLFDEILGAGAPLSMADDDDLAYRLLRCGYTLLCAPDARVIHAGFREWGAARSLMLKSGTGLGAAYMKHLRLGDVQALLPLVVESVRAVNWSRLIRLRSPTGLGYALAYLRGMKSSFSYQVDPRRKVFLPKHADAPDIRPTSTPTGTAP